VLVPKFQLWRNTSELSISICPHPVSISRPMLVPYTYSLKPAHRIALAHIGQLSAFVYRVRSPHAAEASAAESLYGPLGSVRTEVQLLIATISPWRVGLPVAEFWFTPVQISSPRLLSLEVWLTMAVPKAAKGHEDPEAVRAELAARIQCARVVGEMPLTVSPGLEMGCCGGELMDPSGRCAAVKLIREASRVHRRAIFVKLDLCYRQRCLVGLCYCSFVKEEVTGCWGSLC
jgi:hypothetical protein